MKIKIPLWAKISGGLALAGGLTYAGVKINKRIKEKREIKNFDKQTITFAPGGMAIKKKPSGLKPGPAAASATASINLNEVVQQIGEALGTAYSWYDPRRGTENESKATIAILKVPAQFIPEVEKLYLNKYKRNLRNDLQQFLDEYYEQVRHLFV